MNIEINGITYRQKEQPKRKPISKTMAAMLMMANAYEYMNPYSRPQKSEKQLDIDIVKEYGLIQQKKSNLSRSQRDWVVWQFEKTFEKVNP